MALQHQHLVMFGLGSLGDAPPNTMQPQLADGVHLRWSFKREHGFPWYGFYLFRRLSRQGQPSLLSSLAEVRGLPRGEYPATWLSTDYGSISSDVRLMVTEQFTPTNVPEFDLNRGTFVRFTFPPNEPARRVELKIGFVSSGSLTVEGLFGETLVAHASVTGTSGGIVTTVLEADAISEIVLLRGPAALIDLSFVPVSQEASLFWSPMEGPIRLPVTHPTYPCTPGQPEHLANARADARSRILYGDPDQFTAAPTLLYNAGTVTLNSGWTIVVGNGTSWSAELVGGVFQVNGETTAYTVAAVVSPTKLILSRRYSGSTASGKGYVINQDNFGQLHDYLAHMVAGGAASGPMLSRSLPLPTYSAGTISLGQGSATVDGANTGWSSLLQGLALQVTHSGSGTLSVVQGSSVVVGSGSSWGRSLERGLLQVAGDTAQYTIARIDSPTQLVLDRPYAGSTAAGVAYTVTDGVTYPIASISSSTRLILKRPYRGPGGNGKSYRVVGGVNTNDPDNLAPAMPRQYTLDQALLGALHPAVAQMLGLYWVDTTAAAGTAYDYLIVADRTGVAELDLKLATEEVKHRGFANLDGYIVFNRRKAATAALPAPTGLKVYALPGSDTRDSDGVLASNSAGLTWDSGISPTGALLPGRPIFYHLWRADLGSTKPGTPPPDSQYLLRTRDRPLLVAAPSTPAGLDPERSPEWPPFPLAVIDKSLPDGWYSYQISGIDIFGRHSRNSAPAQWHQWGPPPPPTPPPWYYRNDPPGPRMIDAFAVRLLDKIPPPPPTAVMAQALDPQDPNVRRDARYNAWWSSLSAAERETVIGLRVRWQWTEEQRLQAPDTREFRIYFQPGSDLPAGYSQPASWQERCYVVGYDQHVTVENIDGRMLRTYELILPAAGDSYRGGLPLTTSLAETTAYAHIGVSAADDKTTTPDNPRWASGRWGGRTGNESPISAPSKVFRVHRSKPARPVLPNPDSDRVFATPADYHGRSFYTFRWPKSDHLMAHVFRALDDSLFRVDWAQRPRPALSGGQTQFFPSEAVEPRWNAATRQQVANDLNQLNTFPKTAAGTAEAMAHYRALSNDALRVLAGLAGNERAFSQITIAPFDRADQLGPDTPSGYVPNEALRSLLDTLDGRATNRYIYRVAYVDGAQNRSELSLAGPPVWLPNVVPPRAPVLTSALGGDREITLTWASNREPDLAEYRIYRADSMAAARDLRLMTLVQTVSVPPGERPAELRWTDRPVVPNADLRYCLTAVDDAGNESDPTAAVVVRAFRTDPPEAPEWAGATHVLVGGATVVRLSWALTESMEVLVQRQVSGTPTWRTITDWLAAGTTTYDDATTDAAAAYSYRLRGRDASGRQSDMSDARQVLPGD